MTTLIESIKVHGLLQPLLVREFREDGRVWFDLIDGERRYRALQAIKAADKQAFERIPVKFFEGSDDLAYFARFVANNERKSHNPFEVAAAVKAMIDRKQSVEKIASKTGITATWIRKVLRLEEKATDRLRKAVEHGAISCNAAFELCQLPEKEQEARLDVYEAVKKARGAREAKRAVRVCRPSLKDLREMVTYGGSTSYWLGVRDAVRWMLGEGQKPAEKEEHGSGERPE